MCYDVCGAKGKFPMLSFPTTTKNIPVRVHFGVEVVVSNAMKCVEQHSAHLEGEHVSALNPAHYEMAQ